MKWANTILGMAARAAPASAAKADEVVAAAGKKADGPSSCPVGNSFSPDTLVLMGDGSRKRIADVELGDVVWAADPVTGEAGPRRVAQLIDGSGAKQLVEVVVDGAGVSPMVATDGHPFWVDDDGAAGTPDGRWIDAVDLKVGYWLKTSGGQLVRVTGTHAYTAAAHVHNLTVADLHTFYVTTGQLDLLTHNCGEARFEVNSAGVVTDLDTDMTRAGKNFIRGGKAEVIARNKADNAGKTVCDDCQAETVPATQSARGVSPDGNETRVDHIWPKSLDGPGNPANGRATCLTCNAQWSATPKGPL